MGKSSFVCMVFLLSEKTFSFLRSASVFQKICLGIHTLSFHKPLKHGFPVNVSSFPLRNYSENVALASKNILHLHLFCSGERDIENSFTQKFLRNSGHLSAQTIISLAMISTLSKLGSAFTFLNFSKLGFFVVYSSSEKFANLSKSL